MGWDRKKSMFYTLRRGRGVEPLRCATLRCVALGSCAVLRWSLFYFFLYRLGGERERKSPGGMYVMYDISLTFVSLPPPLPPPPQAPSKKRKCPKLRAPSIRLHGDPSPSIQPRPASQPASQDNRPTSALELTLNTVFRRTLCSNPKCHHRYSRCTIGELAAHASLVTILKRKKKTWNSIDIHDIPLPYVFLGWRS